MIDLGIFTVGHRRKNIDVTVESVNVFDEESKQINYNIYVGNIDCKSRSSPMYRYHC